MKRIPLILTAALAVAASTAAAAGIDLNADDPTLDDLSSGTSSIEDCTNGLHLDVLHSDTYDDTVNDWYVTGVRITAADHDTGGSILDDCLDMALSVAIDDDQDTNLVVLGPVVLTTDTITDGTIELPVGDDTLIPVRDAHEIAALIERNLDAPAAGEPSIIETFSGAVRNGSTITIASTRTACVTPPELPYKLWDAYDELTGPIGTELYVHRQLIVECLELAPGERLMLAGTSNGTGMWSADDGLAVNGTSVCDPNCWGWDFTNDVLRKTAWPVDLTEHITDGFLVIEQHDIGGAARSSDLFLVKTSG